jgi:hypothetical protein
LPATDENADAKPDPLEADVDVTVVAVIAAVDIVIADDATLIAAVAVTTTAVVVPIVVLVNGVNGSFTLIMAIHVNNDDESSYPDKHTHDDEPATLVRFCGHVKHSVDALMGAYVPAGHAICENKSTKLVTM